MFFNEGKIFYVCKLDTAMVINLDLIQVRLIMDDRVNIDRVEMLEQLTAIIVKYVSEHKLVANLLGDVLTHKGLVPDHLHFTQLVHTKLLGHPVQEQVEHVVRREVKKLHLVRV